VVKWNDAILGWFIMDRERIHRRDAKCAEKRLKLKAKGEKAWKPGCWEAGKRMKAQR